MSENDQPVLSDSILNARQFSLTAYSGKDTKAASFCPADLAGPRESGEFPDSKRFDFAGNHWLRNATTDAKDATASGGILGRGCPFTVPLYVRLCAFSTADCNMRPQAGLIWTDCWQVTSWRPSPILLAGRLQRLCLTEVGTFPATI